jgi:hypothetical protein
MDFVFHVLARNTPSANFLSNNEPQLLAMAASVPLGEPWEVAWATKW